MLASLYTIIISFILFPVSTIAYSLKGIIEIIWRSWPWLSFTFTLWWYAIGHYTISFLFLEFWCCLTSPRCHETSYTESFLFLPLTSLFIYLSLTASVCPPVCLSLSTFVPTLLSLRFVYSLLNIKLISAFEFDLKKNVELSIFYVCNFRLLVLHTRCLFTLQTDLFIPPTVRPILNRRRAYKHNWLIIIIECVNHSICL